MFSSWAAAMENTKVRVLLLLVGLLATLALAPMSAFGTYMLLVTLISDAPDGYQFLVWSIVGTGGLIGLIGAWVRLLVPGRHFESSRTLKWITSGALGAGVLISGFMFFVSARSPMNPIIWFAGATLAIGVFLFGATVGVKPRAL